MSYKVLIVDDNKEFRSVLHDYLKLQKLELGIFEADSGEKAIELARQKKPDIILMDIRLQHVNGIIASERIKEEQPACDIIILTMFDSSDYKRLCHKNGIFKDFIVKSELHERLMPVIRRCIKKRKSDYA